MGASFAGASVGSGAFGCALSAAGAAAVASSFSAFAGAFASVFSSAAAGTVSGEDVEVMMSGVLPDVSQTSSIPHDTIVESIVSIARQVIIFFMIISPFGSFVRSVLTCCIHYSISADTVLHNYRTVIGE